MKPPEPGVRPHRRDRQPVTAEPAGLRAIAGGAISEADLLDRLALWLADVSAEAAFARSSSPLGGTPERPADPRSQAVEPLR